MRQPLASKHNQQQLEFSAQDSHFAKSDKNLCIRMFRIKFSFLKIMSKYTSFLAVFTSFLRLVSLLPIEHCAKLANIQL
jgi:hypothetical protein